jgi:hypothetical protein
MKNLVNTVSAVSLFAVSGLAMADQCPDSLSLDDLYDCIVVEGAGGIYKPSVPVQPEAAEEAKAVDSIDNQAQREVRAVAQEAPY